MPSFFERIAGGLKAFSRKDDPAFQSYTQFLGIGNPIYTPKDYTMLAREGFEKNITVYRATSLIAQSCAGIPWKLYQKGSKLHEVDSHPILDILANPNPRFSQTDFIEEVVAYWILSGNSYVTAVRPRPGEPPSELWVLRPDRMRVVPGISTISGYEYQVDGLRTLFDANDILHLRMFAATNDWYGLSPVMVAGALIDQQNEGADWNTAILQNAGRPSGALVATGVLGNDQYERLKRVLREKYQGKRNAGMPMLLEGGLDWKQFSMTPLELDWQESRKQNMRDIAIALGVPPELLGDSSNKTYSNYMEARKSFYQETILPLMDKLRDRLNVWLVMQYDSHFYLDYDREKIEALQEDRDSISTRMLSQWEQGIVTLNETRQALGLDDLDGGDILQMTVQGKVFIPTARLAEIVTKKLEDMMAPPPPAPAPPAGQPTQLPDTNNPSTDTADDSQMQGAGPEKDATGGDDSASIGASAAPPPAHSTAPHDQTGVTSTTNTAMDFPKPGADSTKPAPALPAKPAPTSTPSPVHGAVMPKPTIDAQFPKTPHPDQAAAPPADDAAQAPAEKPKRPPTKDALGPDELKRIDENHTAWTGYASEKLTRYFIGERDAIVAAVKNAALPETALLRAKMALRGQRIGLQDTLTDIYRHVGQLSGDDTYGRLMAGKKDESIFQDPHQGQGSDRPTNANQLFQFWNEGTQQYLLHHAGDAVDMIAESTIDAYINIIQSDVLQHKTLAQIAQDLADYYDMSLIPNRSKAIARTEISTAMNFGARVAAISSGVATVKMWLSMEDARVRPDHAEADGQQTGMYEPFVVGGDQLMFPGDRSMGARAGTLVNCRCMALYLTERKSEPPTMPEYAPVVGEKATDDRAWAKEIDAKIEAAKSSVVRNKRYAERAARREEQKHGSGNQKPHGNRYGAGTGSGSGVGTGSAGGSSYDASKVPSTLQEALAGKVHLTQVGPNQFTTTVGGKDYTIHMHESGQSQQSHVGASQVAEALGASDIVPSAQASAVEGKPAVVSEGKPAQPLTDANVEETIAHQPLPTLAKAAIFEYISGLTNTKASDYGRNSDGSISLVHAAQALLSHNIKLAVHSLIMQHLGGKYLHAAIDHGVLSHILSQETRANLIAKHFSSDVGYIGFQQRYKVLTTLAKTKNPTWGDFFNAIGSSTPAPHAPKPSSGGHAPAQPHSGGGHAKPHHSSGHHAGGHGHHSDEQEHEEKHLSGEHDQHAHGRRMREGSDGIVEPAIESVMGSDTFQRVLTKKLDIMNIDSSVGDMFLHALSHEQGYDAKPQLVSTQELDHYIAQGDTELQRGFTDPAYAQQFQQGDFYAARGIHGNGTYTSYDGKLDVAHSYAQENGAVARMALKSGAKVIAKGDLQEMQAHEFAIWRQKEDQCEMADDVAGIRHYQTLRQTFSDLGRYATAHGYDAIDVQKYAYMVILNRSAVRVQKEFVG